MAIDLVFAAKLRIRIAKSFAFQLRARNTAAGSPEPPTSFLMGLSLTSPLAGCLNSVVQLAQRLQVFAVVGGFWQGHDVVQKDGCGDAARCSAVAAQRLLAVDRVADAAPPGVLAACVCARTFVSRPLSHC